LEAYPQIRQLLAQIPEPVDLRPPMQWPGLVVDVYSQLEELSRQHPEWRQTKSVCLKPEFVQMVEEIPWLKGLVAAGEHEYPAQLAEILEPMQVLALFPGLPPETKMGCYYWLASLYVTLKDLFGEMRRSQYGAEPLDVNKMFNLAGQFFEMVAQACRGRPTQTKGRYNLELIGLVKMIEAHQTEKMSSGEIREAVVAAGVSIPEGETWRLWLWRARKAGLLPRGSAAPTLRSKKPY